MTGNNAIWPETIIQNNFDDPLLLSEMEGGAEHLYLISLRPACFYISP